MTLTDAMMLLAVLVVVPAAVPLHPAGNRRMSVAAGAAALPALPAHLAAQGTSTALLVAPWAAASAAGAFLTVRWWWRTGRRLRDAVWPAAGVYLVVGAAWLLADRLALEPAGFSEPFVQLTAIHFHYAGFTAAVLAGCAWRRCPHSRTAAAAALLTVGSPPVIAAGFAAVGLLQIVGAVALTLGLWLLAWVTVRHIAPRAGLLARVLLVLSSLAVLAPMALAVQWAVGANFGTPALPIPAMVVAHGVANALGFSLLGVAGWRLAAREHRLNG